MKSEDVMEIRGALDLLRRDVEDAKSDLNEFVMDGMDMSEAEEPAVRKWSSFNVSTD